MRLWLIPMTYALASLFAGFAVPRLEHSYLAAYTLGISVSSTQAYLSAVASGMMALTGIVFSMAFVMVQFSAIAYSPRLVLWLSRDNLLFHSLGAFIATFTYSLATLAWVDRGGSGAVPFFSSLVVAAMLVLSMILFSRLVQRIGDLQITKVLALIGNRGREVIRSEFDAREMIETSSPARSDRLAPVTQVLKYSGEPRSITSLDSASLVRQAAQAEAVIAMACAVGDTLVEGTVILRVHGGKSVLNERRLLKSVRLGTERTFEQDPKYPIRLLVDIAIRALSPAVNDPTTAVQAIDQIEDLLYRLGRASLDSGYAGDDEGALRLTFPMPTWDDYLALAFDEIRQFGAGSVQVMRRLRSALVAVAESTPFPERSKAVSSYIEHLDAVIRRSPFDAEDQTSARQEDRQGLGLTRKAEIRGLTTRDAPRS